MYKLSIIDREKGINCQVKYENMARAEKPEVIAKTRDGKIVKEKSVYKGKILSQGDTNRMWCDDEGNFHEKKELHFFSGDEEIGEIAMTKAFDIQAYEPLSNYTDRYVIDKFYEIMPANNDMKSDYDREMAIKVNLSQMKKLWDFLMETKQVARGEMNVSSRGFISSDGYLRPISIEGKWTLELGIFSQPKTFEHLNEPDLIGSVSAASPIIRKKLKMV
ncbi:hypothetical protein CCP3SC15_150043 [Gammaproteobacteria bacterium]